MFGRLSIPFVVVEHPIPTEVSSFAVVIFFFEHPTKITFIRIKTPNKDDIFLILLNFDLIILIVNLCLLR